MRIAIVHDFLNQYGGAEKVVEVMHEIWHQATVYTSIYDKEKMPDTFRHMDIKTSFMQKLPLWKRHYKKYLLLYPKAFESFDLSGYEVILSSSSSFAKFIKKPDMAIHICYIHSPARFIWDYQGYIEREQIPVVYRKLLPAAIKYLREKDLESSAGVDYFIANSENIKNRVKECYGREAEVIYPPVECRKFNGPSGDEGYFLIVSRLREYKRIDVAVEAFNKLGWRLKIIGDGSHRDKLEKMAAPNIEFLGSVHDSRLHQYYKDCRALIFTGNEDFGLTPVEAQCCGKPVIAYKAGGALETVRNEGSFSTGVFFYPQTKEALIDVLRHFNPDDFTPSIIREHAWGFDKSVFKRKLKGFVEAKYKEFING